MRARSARTAAWAAIAFAVAATPALAASAETQFPRRPIRLVSGSIGSTSDFAARFVGQRLSERWGQQVVVDNRSGAGGIIAGELVANSAPDGHTLYVGGINSQVSAPLLFKKVPFDPIKDFTPITLLTNSGLILVVVPGIPASNLKEFVAYARTRTGGLDYSSAAIGTSSHLTGELFGQVTGVKLNHIPYKGTGFSVNALFTGEVQASFLSTTTTSAQVKAGKLKALALLADKRLHVTPDIPTSVEQGYKGLESYVWFGLLAPARLPKELLARINAEVVSILRLPESRTAMNAQGAEPTPTTPEEFGRYIQSEISKWGKVIRDAKVVVN
jgi:tripartite-type tricarboxylate transporter receptor subunit TctC